VRVGLVSFNGEGADTEAVPSGLALETAKHQLDATYIHSHRTVIKSQSIISPTNEWKDIRTRIVNDDAPLDIFKTIFAKTVNLNDTFSDLYRIFADEKMAELRGVIIDWVSYQHSCWMG
jgi:hypothetical protein